MQRSENNYSYPDGMFDERLYDAAATCARPTRWLFTLSIRE
jgi:hypothetical protein